MTMVRPQSIRPNWLVGEGWVLAARIGFRVDWIVATQRLDDCSAQNCRGGEKFGYILTKHILSANPNPLFSSRYLHLH